MNIKNNIITSISHIYRNQEIITKTVYYVTNINSTEAELFAIRYGISYAIHLQDINYIIVIIDTMLRSMPLGNNVDLGKGYDDMIGCATCSLSQHLMQ